MKIFGEHASNNILSSFYLSFSLLLIEFNLNFRNYKILNMDEKYVPVFLKDI